VESLSGTGIAGYRASDDCACSTPDRGSRRAAHDRNRRSEVLARDRLTGNDLRWSDSYASRAEIQRFSRHVAVSDAGAGAVKRKNRDVVFILDQRVYLEAR
jgi:hypothetical protein